MTTVPKLENFIKARQTIESLLAIPPNDLTDEQLKVRINAAKFLGELDANIFFVELYEKDCV